MLVYGVFGFLMALMTASLIGVDIDPVVLSEALPFLVITVGFEKPFTLARAIFTNPALTPINGASALRSRVASRSNLASPRLSTIGRVSANGQLLSPYANGHANGDHHDDSYDSFAAARNSGLRWGQPIPARDIVMQGINKVGYQIATEYAIEIAVLLAGSFTGVAGLTEFCRLAALILFFDCLFLFGFFAAILTVMVEVRRSLAAPMSLLTFV